MLSELRRFISSTTRTAEAVACVLVAASWELGERLAHALAFVGVPRGQSLMFRSVLDLHDHGVFAKYTLTLLPVLGWLLASWRGYRRRVPVGTGAFLRLTGIVTAAAAVAAAADMLLIHHLWSAALAESGARGITPMVDVGSLNHWHWALHAALPTSLGLAIREARARA
jgi:hypothetical protein